MVNLLFTGRGKRATFRSVFLGTLLFCLLGTRGFSMAVFWASYSEFLWHSPRIRW